MTLNASLQIILLKIWGFQDGDNSQYAIQFIAGFIGYTKFSGRCTNVSEEHTASAFETDPSKLSADFQGGKTNSGLRLIKYSSQEII